MSEEVSEIKNIEGPFKKYVVAVFTNENDKYVVSKTEWLTDTNPKSDGYFTIRIAPFDYSGESDLNRKCNKSKPEKWSLCECKIIATSDGFDECVEKGKTFSQYGKTVIDKKERHKLKRKEKSPQLEPTKVNKEAKKPRKNNMGNTSGNTKEAESTVSTGKSEPTISRSSDKNDTCSECRRKEDKLKDYKKELNNTKSLLKIHEEQNKTMNKLTEKMTENENEMKDKIKSLELTLQEKEKELFSVKEEVEKLKNINTEKNSQKRKINKKGEEIKSRTRDETIHIPDAAYMKKLQLAVDNPNKIDFGNGVLLKKSIVESIASGNIPGIMIRDFLTAVMKRDTLHEYSLSGRVSNIHKNKKDVEKKKKLPPEVFLAIKTFMNAVYPTYSAKSIANTIRSHLSNCSYSKKATEKIKAADNEESSNDDIDSDSTEKVTSVDPKSAVPVNVPVSTPQKIAESEGDTPVKHDSVIDSEED